MKNKIIILIFTSICIIPILQGYDNDASIIYRHLLIQDGTSNMYFQLYNLFSFVALSIGLLFGGLAIDKWNFKLLAIISLIGLAIISLILQFNDSYAFVIIQRFVLSFSFGFLMVGFKVFLSEISEPKHRGKLLYAFINISIIGIVIYRFLFHYFEISIMNPDLSYAHLQMPFIILPLFVLLVIRYLPDSQKSEPNKLIPISYFFKPNQKGLTLILITMALLLSFANSELYLNIAAQIAMDTQNEYMHIIPTILWLVAVIFGILSIDYFGRKRLLKFGIIALILSAVLNIVISFATNHPMITFAFLYLYNFITIYTITTTATIIILEYLPRPIRGRGMVLFAFMYWIPNTIKNSVIYPFIFDSEYQVGIVSMISLTALITSLYLIHKHLIETNGLSLEKIKNKIDVK